MPPATARRSSTARARRSAEAGPRRGHGRGRSASRASASAPSTATSRPRTRSLRRSPSTTSSSSPTSTEQVVAEDSGDAWDDVRAVDLAHRRPTPPTTSACARSSASRRPRSRRRGRPGAARSRRPSRWSSRAKAQAGCARTPTGGRPDDHVRLRAGPRAAGRRPGCSTGAATSRSRSTGCAPAEQPGEELGALLDDLGDVRVQLAVLPFDDHALERADEREADDADARRGRRAGGWRAVAATSAAKRRSVARMCASASGPAAAGLGEHDARLARVGGQRAHERRDRARAAARSASPPAAGDRLGDRAEQLVGARGRRPRGTAPRGR